MIKINYSIDPYHCLLFNTLIHLGLFKLNKRLMLKKYFPLIIFFYLFVLGNIYAQTTLIPDTNFEQALINLGIDTDNTINGSVATTDIDGITYLDVRYHSISNMTGIEDFISLVILYCSGNPITSIVVSGATNLNELWCEDTELVSLDLSQNAALTMLVGWNNNLSSLNVYGAIALRTLYCSDNQLTSLDLSQNTALEDLDCSNNQIQSLELSQNTALKNLICSNNQLTILDVRNGNNSSILNFNATNNLSLVCIEVDNETDANNGIAPYNNWQKDATATYSEDCGYNNEIPIAVNDEYETFENTSLIINQNEGVLSNDIDVLTAILVSDVSNGTLELFSDGSFNYTPNNEFIGTDSFTYKANDGSVDSNIATVNIIVKIFVPNQTNIPDANFEQALIDLGYDDVLDGYVDPTIISGITSLDIHYKNISDLTGIEDFTSLDTLNCTNNQITSLDMSQNTELSYLKCGLNQLTNLDVSQNTELSFLECYNNNLDNLNVSSNPALESLNCTNNQLTNLIMDSNPELKFLWCVNNQLTNLDVSQNTILMYLHCYTNKIENLNVSNNSYLRRLECEDNLLTSLEVNNNPQLWLLICNNNQLESLDLDNCTSLIDLVCYNNKLTELIVETNTLLGGLYCQNNLLTSLDVSYNTELRFLNADDNTELTGLHLTKVDSPKSESSKISQKAAIASNDRLSHIEVNNTGLVALDISNVPNLETLNAQGSKLTSIDVSNNSILSVLDLTNNPLTCIQVSQEQLDNIPTGWEVDATTPFSTDCENYLGVDDELLTEGLKLYPNPVSDMLTVDSKLPLSKVEIYSILGQRVKEIDTNLNSISLNNLSNGIYIVRIYFENGTTVRKLIKQ